MVKLINFEARRIRQAYRRVFQTEDGKKIIEDLAAFSGFAQSTTDPDSPQMSAFNDGQRRILLRILSLSSTDPVAAAQNALQSHAVTSSEED